MHPINAVVSNQLLIVFAILFMLMAAFRFTLPEKWQRVGWEWLSFACVFATLIPWGV